MTKLPARPSPWLFRDTSHWNEEVFLYGSMEAFLARDETPSGIHTIQAGGTLFDALLWNRGSDLTVVQYHAAVTNRDELCLPVFTGRRLMGNQVNAIFLSDASMYFDPSLRLGWFEGSDGCHAPTVTSTILRDLLRAIGSPRVAFLGYSLGGFAALKQSFNFPGSLCIPVNPQIDLALFNPNHLATYARICFGVTGRDQVLARLRQHTIIDLRDLYRRNTPNHILYLQNTSDRHRELHQQPFMATLPAPSRTQLVLGHWGDGHVGPTTHRMAALINLLRRWQGTWQTLIDTDLSWFAEPEREPDASAPISEHVQRERQRRAAEREAGTLG